jgi:hypothetical protein
MNRVRILFLDRAISSLVTQAYTSGALTLHRGYATHTMHHGAEPLPFP